LVRRREAAAAAGHENHEVRGDALLEHAVVVAHVVGPVVAGLRDGAREVLGAAAVPRLDAVARAELVGRRVARSPRRRVAASAQRREAAAGLEMRGAADAARRRVRLLQGPRGVLLHPESVADDLGPQHRIGIVELREDLARRVGAPLAGEGGDGAEALRLDEIRLDAAAHESAPSQ